MGEGVERTKKKEEKKKGNTGVSYGPTIGPLLPTITNVDIGPSIVNT